MHLLAGQLHAAVGRAEALARWIAAVRKRFDALSAFMFESQGGGLRVIADPPGACLDPGAVAAMRSALARRAPGEAVTYSTTVPWTAEAAMALRLSAAGALHPSNRVLGLVMLRPSDSAADEGAVLEYLAALTWHIFCAQEAGMEVGRLSGHLAPADVVETLPLPCVLTDVAGRAIDRNHAFGIFMATAGMQLSTGRLCFSDPYSQEAWLLALAEVQATAVRQSILVPGHDGAQWRLHLVPWQRLPEGTAVGERALILAVVEQLHVDGALAMGGGFPQPSRPLTPAESEVFSAMLQGHSAKVIANARGASVNTVRSQIMTILGKTGHHNQKSLIAAFAPSGFRSSMMSGTSPAPIRVLGKKQ